MKAIVGERYGPPEVLELREVDRPRIEGDQVLVRVRASSVNPAEWYRVHGPFFMRPAEGVRRPKRAALGTDVAGQVDAVGKEASEFRPGDEVFGSGLGAWAEYAVARESHLVRKPANVSFEEVAAVPIAALTACRLCATTRACSRGRRFSSTAHPEASAATPCSSRSGSEQT
jgi:NADPH:quinone reductase-like Zn-dependent oxidoreductase